MLSAGEDSWQKRHEAIEPNLRNSANVELACRRKDGTTITFDISARTLEDGRFLAFAGDATERKQAKAAVPRASEVQLKHIIETSPVGIAAINLDGFEILFTNTRFNELLGRPGDHLVGEDPRAYFANPDDGAAIVRQSQNGERMVDREVAFRNADGGAIWALLTAVVLNLAGQEALVAWIYDITELKQAEMALLAAKDDAANARALLADAIEHSSDGFVLFDADDPLAAYNSKYQEFYGYSDDDLKPGVTGRDLYVVDDQRQTIA